MSASLKKTGRAGCRRWTQSLAALALAWGGSALAQEVVSVPAAHLNHAEGSVAWAPQGDKEWHDVQPRRVLKRGDRLWTDRGSRAEVQAGGHALRLNGETQLVLENVGPTSTQLSLTQGVVVATVTHLNPGDSFELGTPNLAFRARQPGDYRIDVDTKQGVTRVVVLSGTGVVYGEKGEAVEIRSGQRVSFRERNLARMPQAAFAATDDFDRWAAARRRGEPTVSMPTVAANTPAPAIPKGLVSKGPTLVIPGGPMQPIAKPGTTTPGLAAAKPAAAAVVAAAPAPAAAPAAAPAPAARPLPPAHALPNVAVGAPMAAPMKVTAPMSAPANSPQVQAAAQAIAQAQAQAQALAQAKAQAAAQAQAAQAQAAARAQAQAEAQRTQERQQRLAQQRAGLERQAAARAEHSRRLAAAESRRGDDRKRALAARHAEEDRKHAQGKRAAEEKRMAAKRAEEERRHALAKRAAEEKRLAAARRDEARIAEARRHQLARLQDQARRDEQAARARREQGQRADDDRREEQARREELARREDLARRDEDLRRQRALAEQARREQERRDQEVWLRQQQFNPPPRPMPMGVPARRVS